MIIEDKGWNNVEVECSKCGERRTTTRNNAKQSETHLCFPCRGGYIAKTRRVFTPHNKGKKYPSKKLGGSYIDTHGYRQVWYGSTEKGRKDGYGLEHRVVLEDFLGRKLSPDELVHHINGVKLDNRVNNLFLCASMSHHRKVHASLERTAFELFRKGFIIFDNGEYKIAPHICEGMSAAGEFGESLSPEARIW